MVRKINGVVTVQFSVEKLTLFDPFNSPNNCIKEKTCHATLGVYASSAVVRIQTTTKNTQLYYTPKRHIKYSLPYSFFFC